MRRAPRTKAPAAAAAMMIRIVLVRPPRVEEVDVLEPDPVKAGGKRTVGDAPAATSGVSGVGGQVRWGVAVMRGADDVLWVTRASDAVALNWLLCNTGSRYAHAGTLTAAGMEKGHVARVMCDEVQFSM